MKKNKTIFFLIFAWLAGTYLTTKFYYPVSLYFGIFPDIEKRMICRKEYKVVFDDIILAPVEPRDDVLYVRLKSGDKKSFIPIPDFSMCEFKDQTE